ncbi:hypothetical protein SmJEL517_g02904 [Synchytrium microbalum]|uniref:Uncharacterized protein n=1 Tax=Synchytrium microbalum TaxID=1806994 RepID=A0A507CAA2_9FUNG|nr:uncharacterized protein SmJEL517_g02904 [Synchytrium microbalum]TPX34473.1 hypothetical protein SmJEL517_g02904 [Synchytrium microbalum]
MGDDIYDTLLDPRQAHLALIGSFQGFILFEVYWFTIPSWNTGLGSGGVVIVYCSLLIIAQFFAAAFAWDAQIHKNALQVIFNVGVFNLGSFVYSLIQLKQLTDLRTGLTGNSGNVQYIDAALPVLYAQIAFTFVFFVAQSYIAYLVWQEYGWSIWMAHGASLRKRATLQRYHFFILFLKLNIFFLLGIVLQVFVAEYWQAKWKNSTTFSLRTVLIPTLVILFLGMILWYILGYYSTHTQSPVNYALMGSYLFLCAINFVAIGIMLVLFNTSTDFVITRDFLNFFAVVSCLFSIATIAWGALLVILDFEGDWLFSVLRGLDYSRTPTSFVRVDPEKRDGVSVELKRSRTVLD